MAVGGLNVISFSKNEIKGKKENGINSNTPSSPSCCESFLIALSQKPNRSRSSLHRSLSLKLSHSKAHTSLILLLSVSLSPILALLLSNNYSKKIQAKGNSPSVVATVMMEPKLHYFASLFQGFRLMLKGSKGESFQKHFCPLRNELSCLMLFSGK
ncbi:uncharacterized protein LOC127129680 [Lathyrus oleraceus]|uniref:uncharacterized protein LOC127129680 n=1 Tax=Pisum sativum TaxID=3888 RepID=UPI0021D1C2D5|nr:uncharacterized protein LOC127129680 [Pisum sativum]